MKLLRLIASVCLLAANTAWALQFTGMEPSYGEPGDLITLTGQDFDAGAAYVARVGSRVAVITDVQNDSLSFRIPADAQTETVSVTETDVVTVFPASLTITRKITVRLAAGLPGYMQDYTFGTVYDSTETGSSSQVSIQGDAVTLVMSAGEDQEPGLFAMATGSESTVELSAQSSALALVFSQPSVGNSDPQIAALVLNVMLGLPEVQALTDSIGQEIASANDYLNDSNIDDDLFNATIAFLNKVEADPGLIQPPSLPGLQSGERADFIDSQQPLQNGYPRDLEVAGYEKLNALDAKATTVQNNERGVPTVGVEMQRGTLEELNSLLRESTGRNFNFQFTSLDWIANLYELDPSDPDLDTRAKADALVGSHTAQYLRMQPQPLARRVIKSSPATGNVDLLGTVQDLLIKEGYKLVDSMVPQWIPPNDLRVPADRSGLYMIRSFSGARFSLQDPLLGITSGLPGAYAEETKMLALNMVMVIMDASGIILKAKDVLGIEDATELGVKLALTATAMIDREYADGTLDGWTVLRLVPILGKELIKNYSKAAIKKLLGKAAPTKFVAQTGNLALKTLDVFSKVAAVAKTGERILALSNAVNFVNGNAWMSQGVQSTLVVVGDPWRPEITSFSPRKAHRGRIVEMTGRNFSEVAEDNIVLFGYSGTSPESETGSVVAEVIWAKKEAIAVRVPDVANTGAITVAVIGKGFSSTARLTPPNDIFTVVEDPVITSISPNPAQPGQLAVVTGQNFAGGIERNGIEFASFGGELLQGSESSLLVRVPNVAGANTITVTVSGRASNAFAFDAVNAETPFDGSLLYITTASDGNVPDGDISLHEAILIGAGALGRDVTRPPNPRPPNVTYESDFANVSPATGAANEDDIRLHSSFPGGPILLTGSLPPLPDFDNYDLDDVVIDGQGLAATGFVFNGNKQVSISDRNGEHVKLKNFTGNCVYFTGGARNHRAIVSVEGCGSDGVLLENDVYFNLVHISSSNNTGHGMRVTGTGVRFNEITHTFRVSQHFTNNGGFGLLVEAGANNNIFSLGAIIGNATGGIRVTGETSTGNVFGRSSSVNSPKVFKNSGPGIWIDAPATRVEDLNISGNSGDGILVEGSMASDVVLASLGVGMVDFTSDGHTQGEALANLGNGIHVRNGAHDLMMRLVFVAGNRDHGIWLEGPDVSDVMLSFSTIGNADFGNGKSGLAITDGAHDNTVGPMQNDYFTDSRGSEFQNHTGIGEDSGAGILLSGEGTRNNLIYGSVFGSNQFAQFDLGNRYGIRITNGASANTIGLRGDIATTTSVPILRTYNLFFFNKEAGILLESGGQLPNQSTLPGEPPLTPTGGNVIQNNFIGRHQRYVYNIAPNRVGILIREGGVANRIGGSNPGEGNIIRNNDRAGIEIDGGTITRPEMANRIIGNIIQAQGSELGLACDPLTGEPQGVGILVSNGASGHIIGGTSPGEGNKIGARKSGVSHDFGNVVGVFIDGSDNNQMAYNDLGFNKIDRGNTCVGTIIRDGSGNFIGPGNKYDQNGGFGGDGLLATLVIKGGSANRVMGNWFGPPLNFIPNSSNGYNHISILDSANNRIGDVGLNNANVILRAGMNGIRIDGVGSTGNQVSGNWIGIAPTPSNTGTSNIISGVYVSGGASDNIIGGKSTVELNGAVIPVVAGNVIRGNRGDGVRVDGAGSQFNSITNNIISGHNLDGRLGIQTQNGGNGELPPPIISSYDGTSVEGTVDGSIPDGSVVQIFTDPGDEGLHFMAEAVVAGGAFSTVAVPWLYANVCATVTHAANGNTSEFSCLQTDPPDGLYGLDIRRSTNPVENIDIQAGRSSAVVSVKLSVGEGDVFVDDMSFDALGSVDESVAIADVSLYLDQDEDGRLSNADNLLADGVVINSDNGSADFTDLGMVLTANTVEHWLLVVTLEDAAAPGETVEFQLVDNSKVDSAGLLPVTPIVETGAFPVNSDQASIVQKMPSGEDIMQAILTGNGYDPAMDLNNDGVVDVADAVMAEQIF